MELKPGSDVNPAFWNDAFNRTAYGIETLILSADPAATAPF